MRRAVEMATLERELRALDNERLRHRLVIETDAARRAVIERERARRETAGRSPASGRG